MSYLIVWTFLQPVCSTMKYLTVALLLILCAENCYCQSPESKLLKTLEGHTNSASSVAFSPDGKYVVTAMQEKALHGWRLRDKGDLAVAGYPAKIKSFAWIGDTPHLATSGADEAICWPFDGTHGPLDRSPVCVAHGGKQVATCVQALAKENAVFAGFRDGAVLLAELDESKDAIVLKGSKGAEVTAIAVTDTLSHLLVGDEKGHILWAPLRTKDTHAKSI